MTPVTKQVWNRLERQCWDQALSAEVYVIDLISNQVWDHVVFKVQFEVKEGA
jgi:tryptophan-rich sensory protein